MNVNPETILFLFIYAALFAALGCSAWILERPRRMPKAKTYVGDVTRIKRVKARFDAQKKGQLRPPYQTGIYD